MMMMMMMMIMLVCLVVVLKNDDDDDDDVNEDEELFLRVLAMDPSIFDPVVKAKLKLSDKAQAELYFEKNF
jgi:hypothetical protein